jgi:hypothetical protein
LTVANFETPAATRHAVQSAAVAAMVTGFGYVFLGAALLTAVTVFSDTFDQTLDHISGFSYFYSSLQYEKSVLDDYYCYCIYPQTLQPK